MTDRPGDEHPKEKHEKQQLLSAAERYKNMVERSAMLQAAERHRNAMEDSGLLAVAERYQTAVERSGLLEAAERHRHVLENSGLLGFTKRFQSAIEKSGLLEAAERHQHVLENSGLMGFSERFQSAIEKSGLLQAAELLRNSAGQSGMRQFHEANSRAFEGIAGLARTFEPYRELLTTVRDQHSSMLSVHGGSSAFQVISGITRELREREQAGEASQGRIIEVEGRASLQAYAFAEVVVVTKGAPTVTPPSTASSWNWSAFPTILLCMILQVLIEWESVRMSLVDINARLPATESVSEVREFIRTELAGKPGDFRIVTGSHVALRVAPSMKSDVILRLPYQAIVVVLEKEDRTWRYVSYELNGFVIDGYVSSKFLKKGR